MRYTFRTTFEQEELSEIKQKVLLWLKSFSTFAYLDNNLYAHQPNRFELLVGAGVQQEVAITNAGSINDWCFGHLAYDYKNHLFPRLETNNIPTSSFELSYFFIPEIVVSIPFGTNDIVIESNVDNAEYICNSIFQEQLEHNTCNAFNNIKHNTVTDFFDKESYIDTVQAIRNHIIEGDCYELNLVNGKIVDNYLADPFALFNRLNNSNPAPFSCLYRNDANFLISSSPERYLYKNAQILLTQPIKGTIKRGKSLEEEAQQKHQLYNDEKERAENVMIVDLMRNDLAKLSEVGTVEVEELFGVYTFKQLHHLISTVKSKLKPNIDLYQVLTEPFPMGSMTGAPKYIVMELIEQYEKYQRNIYSGTVGYISPNQDFDFNVVIRSLVYNTESKRVVFHTGGAITFDSSAEQEWNETVLKALAMENVLKN